MINGIQSAHIHFNNGEGIELKDLFSNYYAPLCAFAYRYLNNHEVSEDIVQDIFILFWEKRGSFPCTNSIKSFFYTSVKNACLDQIKHSTVVAKYKNIQPYKNRMSESFLDEVIRSEAYSEVYHEINLLPDMERRVLLLALEEKSNEEIANLLSISLNTVKTHKSRAYKVLRKHLSDVFLFSLFFR